MKKSLKFVGVLGILLFVIGVLAGMFFYTTATWADIEAVFYGFVRYSSRPTSALRCPVYITDAETGVVHAVIENTAETKIRPTIRFETSNKGLMVPQTERITLQPGETQRLSWNLSPDNEVMGHFVFTKLVFYSAYPLPDREQTCGILSFDITFLTGFQLSLLLTIGSVLLMLAGDVLWGISHNPLEGRSLDVMRGMVLLTIVVLVGIVSALVASWVLGLAALVVAILLIGAIIGNLLQSA